MYFHLLLLASSALVLANQLHPSTTNEKTDADPANQNRFSSTNEEKGAGLANQMHFSTANKNLGTQLEQEKYTTESYFREQNFFTKFKKDRQVDQQKFLFEQEEQLDRKEAPFEREDQSFKQNNFPIPQPNFEFENPDDTTDSDYLNQQIESTSEITDEYCEDCLEPPPLFEISPPPHPPFLSPIPLLLSKEEINSLPPEEECNFCEWIHQHNVSDLLRTKYDSWSLSPLLAGVSIGSALTGALLTIVCIHCRRLKCSSKHRVSESGGSNPYCQMTDRFNENNIETKRNGVKASASSVDKHKSCPTKLGPRNLQFSNLCRTSCSPSSNSYTGGPTEHVSPSVLNNCYPEIEVSKEINSRKLEKLGTNSSYENAGFNLSENPEETIGTLETMHVYTDVTQVLPKLFIPRFKKKNETTKLDIIPSCSSESFILNVKDLSNLSSLPIADQYRQLENTRKPLSPSDSGLSLSNRNCAR